MKRKGQKGRKTKQVENGDAVDENRDSGSESEDPINNDKNGVVEPEPEESASKEDGEPPKKVKKTAKKKEEEPKESADESESDDEPEYEVEEVLDEKVAKGLKQFLIRWKGYGEDSDTWEPASTLNCPDKIKEYEKNKKGKGKGKSPKKIVKKTEKVARGRKKKVTKEPEEVEEWDENEDFEVDRIIEVHHKRDGKREFLVHWKGYTTADNSWEPEENLNCDELILKFMEKVEHAKESDTKELRVVRAPTQRFVAGAFGSSNTTGIRHSKRQSKSERKHYFGDD